MSTTPTAPAIIWQVETGLLGVCITQGALDELLHEWLGDRNYVRVLDYTGSQFSYGPEMAVSVLPADVEVVRIKLLLLGATLEGFDARRFGGKRGIPHLLDEYVRLAEPNAAPNGGPATPSASSGATEGPPSVS